MKRNIPIFIYLIVGLATIGLVASLIRNPGHFLIRIFVMIGIAFVVFLIFNAIVNRSRGGSNNEMKKYRKAVKQSKQKYNQNEKITRQKTKPIKRKRKRTAHLTVIEGKKTVDKKDDDRASN